MPLMSIAWGAVSGVLYGLNGWFRKNDPKSRETFNPAKFVVPVVIGAIVGAVAAYSGFTFEIASVKLESLGLLTAIEIGLSAGIKNVLKKAVKR